MANIRSGIGAFDESIGGLPSGSIITFLGEADTGMTTCAEQILYQGLSEGRPAVYFTTGRSWEDVVGEMAVFGRNLDNYFEKRKIGFVDRFTMKKGKISVKVL